MATDLREIGAIDKCIRRLLNATNEAAAIGAVRALFVEQLDFDAQPGSIALHGDDLPPTAVRIAERDGVQVVVVRLRTTGRVLVRDIRSALKEIRGSLNGDVLLVAGDAEGGEWQLVYPGMQGGREVLRRITLHRGHPHRTVVTQLSKVYDQAAKGDLRAALESAYDVEAVTKEFFREYKRVFDGAMTKIKGLPDDNERRLFCQTLFNRLMFIYFLQRKGWLRFNGSTDYLHALWDEAMLHGENFYEVRLRQLFFVGLSSPRSGQYEDAREALRTQIGDVPFLNGGLFSEEEVDRNRDIHVPNTAIAPLLNELFKKFNFTIAESTPYDVQVAVDPEMLGKVFEELVTGRHETGSYYTPRPIVSFMCREALKGYLRTRVPELMEDAAARYVDEQDVSGISVQQAPRILAALEEITVVDPACGSGAYLLGMMQELIECEGLLFNQSLIQESRSLYDMKLRIIERNVYGVDIDPFAVNIAMLRLWLSLIVEYEGDDPPPLPNLDFKIACGDSLTGPNPQEPLGDMFRATAARMANELTELKGQYLRTTGDEKEQLHREIEHRMQDLGAMMAHSDMPGSAIDWRVQFAEVFEDGGFDVVVANPPYVRMESIQHLKPAMQARFPDAYSGRADLYVYFYVRAVEMLCRHGMLGFISSNKWLRVKYGASLRAFMAGNARISSITDFRDLPVFEAATAYPMIFVAQKGAKQDRLAYTEVPSLASPYPDVRRLVGNVGVDLPASAISGSTWTLADPGSSTRYSAMASTSIPLTEYVGGRFYYGIKTGLNEAFVLDAPAYEEIVRLQPECANIMRPLLMGTDIHRWYTAPTSKWLIYTRPGIDMRPYGAILQHLRKWRGRLAARALDQKWYELQQAQYRYAQSFTDPKIEVNPFHRTTC